jgi:hypothetical protein
MEQPRLPRELELKLPPELVHIIYRFAGKHPKPKPKSPVLSHTVQTKLTQIQNSPALKGKNEMFLYGLEDYLLDGR